MADDYSVVSQRSTTVVTDANGLQNVVEIKFKTIPEGIIGTVDIPSDNYTLDTAKAAIEAQVATLKAVHAL
jgi:hypothetical protein